MTESAVAAIEDPNSAQLALRGTGLLHEFNLAGILQAADVHVANRLGELAGEFDEQVRLAAALAVRAVREGSVCLDLAQVAQADPSLPWPEPAPWIEKVRASLLVAGPEGAAEPRPLRWDLGLLYLDRYWRQEEAVRSALASRAERIPPSVDLQLLDDGLDRLFTDDAPEQRAAARRAVTGWTTVISGGPGTGKTATVAKILAVLLAGEPGLRIALAAPTGKAAARMQEAIRESVAGLDEQDRARVGDREASTLHRLLGWKPGQRTRFKHDKDNRLPHDVVIVDETSMVPLTMMARLLDALRPDARLILLGDPDQLASVEAGAVLADLVAGLAADPGRSAGRGSVVRLAKTWRFGGRIAELAEAVRDGDADAAAHILEQAEGEVVPVDAGDPGVVADVVSAGTALRAAAWAGDARKALARLGAHRLLCAHRTGPYGVDHWSRLIERWLAEASGVPPSAGNYLGRPVLITENDYTLGLYNGDAGVVIRGDDGRPRVAFERGSGIVRIAPSRLGRVQTMHALTVHRSQGSQFDHVSVVLPPEDSALSTREMLYTALTRAQSLVRLIGTPEQLRAAIGRRAIRASGLRARLTAPPPVKGTPSHPPVATPGRAV